MQIFNFLTAAPKLPDLSKFDDFTKDWTNWMTGKGGSVNDILNRNNEFVKFYKGNDDFLYASNHAINNLIGYIQNGIYGFLSMLLNGVQALIRAALLPLYDIPKMLMNSNSSLHIVFIAMITLGIGLASLALGVSMYSYLTGKNDEYKTKFRNVTFNIAAMILLPFIFLAGGEAMNSVVGQKDDLPNLAQSVIRDNTVDLQNWAIHGFEQEPFTKDAPKYNNIEKYGVPDFSEGIDKDGVKIINQAALDGKNSRYKDIGKVFEYQLVDITNGNGGIGYQVRNLDLSKNVFNSMSSQYKRYHIQNFTAIFSFLILIVVGFMMAIKVARSTIGVLGHMLSTPVAAGRDGAKSVEGVKSSIMELFNSWLAIYIDLALLYLFVDLMGTLPNDIANNFDDPVQQGLVRVFIMGMLAFAIYNGSSVLERQFGFSSGGQSQSGLARSFAAPGVMLGSALAGSALRKRREKRLAKKREKMEAFQNQPAPHYEFPSDGGKRGKEAAELLSNMNRNKGNNSNNNGVSNTNGFSTSRNKANGSEQAQDVELNEYDIKARESGQDAIGFDEYGHPIYPEKKSEEPTVPTETTNTGNSNEKTINKSNEKKPINRGNFKDIDWGNTGSKSHSGTNKNSIPETFNPPVKEKPINRGRTEDIDWGDTMPNDNVNNYSSKPFQSTNQPKGFENNEQYLTKRPAPKNWDKKQQKQIDRLRQLEQRNQEKNQKHAQKQSNRFRNFFNGLNQSSEEPTKPTKH